MRTTRDHYEVLGVPRTATADEIKDKYRQLVRKFHPDVAKDKDTAHKIFIQLNQAYEILSDPMKRKDYDQSLIAGADGRNATPAGPGAANYQQQPNGARAQAPRPGPPKPKAAQILKEAQWSFVEKRFNEAMNKCKDAIRIDPTNPDAHVLMGDIFRAQKNMHGAAESYTYAQHLRPGDVEIKRKLSSLVDKTYAKGGAGGRPAMPMNKMMIVNVVGWGAAFLLLGLINITKSGPEGAFGNSVPMVSGWCWQLVVFMGLASALVGGLLALNGLVASPNDEVLPAKDKGPMGTVSGVVLTVGSFVFFLGAAVLYLILSAAKGKISKSVVVAFGAVIGIVLLGAILYGEGAGQVFLFGGNVAFLFLLAGWYAGASMKASGDFGK